MRREHRQPGVVDWRAPVPQLDSDPLSDATRLLARAVGDSLSERDAAAVFAAIGVPMAPAAFLDDPSAEFDADITFPVAAKVLSVDLPHKTEAGAVALNIPDREALKEQTQIIWDAASMHAPNARLDGILIQPMVFLQVSTDTRAGSKLINAGMFFMYSFL